ncbi:cation-translocating P-type ATPase, partial [Candidatus Nomurabacteria bacterium]|nr:cation-translocating P-type ATPase [Candidatus Nomurabacteria bacterium]
MICVLVLSLLIHFLSKLNFFSENTYLSNVDYFLLLSTSIIGIIPVIWSAILALKKKTITVDLLASIALIFTIIEAQWVSAVFINLMLTSARLFAVITERRTENVISHLLKLRPNKVKIKEGEYSVDKKLEEIKIGDIVIIESGDRIAVDGEVVGGQASINQSSLTGESEPVSKTVGGTVLSSTLCVDGSLLVRADKIGKDTALEKMIALVDEASRAKTKVETMANKFSAWYIIATLSLAIFVYII